MRDSNFFFTHDIRYHEDEMIDVPDSDAEDEEHMAYFAEENEEECGDALLADLKNAACRMLDYCESDDIVYTLYLPHNVRLRVMMLRFADGNDPMEFVPDGYDNDADDTDSCGDSVIGDSFE